MNRWSALAGLLALVAALALRLPHLSVRPLHNDEAVNATKVAELWQEGRYAYDPDEYHGPTLHYATVPFLWLSGARSANQLPDSALRWVTVAFGVGLILLLPLFSNGLGKASLTWAALFIAISPAMVFYSRYFIHEMLLVFFSALMLGAGWKYSQTHSWKWAALTGASIGLMFATKETFVLTLAAAGAALILTMRLIRAPSIFRKMCGKNAGIAIAAALVVWLLFFSSFFTNLSGLADSVRTYMPWLKRAGGHSPHIHPWYFYLQRLAWFHPAKGPIWSEGLILALAIVGAVSSLRRRTNSLACFLSIYTLVLTAIYSVISYKTPWCLLNFYFGMILLAGIGAVSTVDFFKHRAAKTLVAAIVLAFAGQLAWQSWRAAVILSADRRNPYVYAQTSPDLLNLVQKVEGVAQLAPSGYGSAIKVISPDGDYWPLPWYLRRFANAGWYDQLPDDPYAPIIIVSSKLDARLDEKSDKKWIMVGYSELRPQVLLELYVELELWKKYVATLPRERD